METIRNLIAAILDRLNGRVSVSSAIVDLDKSLARLKLAEEYHEAQTERFVYAAEQANTEAQNHENAAIRAARIRSKLSELLA